jgi:hypothetical protein
MLENGKRSIRSVVAGIKSAGTCTVSSEVEVLPCSSRTRQISPHPKKFLEIYLNLITSFTTQVLEYGLTKHNISL